MKRVLPTFLVGALAFFGCARPNQQKVVQEVSIEDGLEEVTIEEGLFDSTSYKYFQVAESEADIVLVVEISLPGPSSVDKHRFPLKRNSKPQLSGVNCNISWRACGPRGGYGGYISISGAGENDDAVNVTVAVSWSRDDEHDEIKHEMKVPWHGDVTGKLDGGSSIRVHFEKPAR